MAKSARHHESQRRRRTSQLITFYPNLCEQPSIERSLGRHGALGMTANTTATRVAATAAASRPFALEFSRNSDQRRLRLGDADNAASHTPARITRRLRFQVVRFFVNDHSVADDRIRAPKFHHLVSHIEMRLAARVRFDVAEIARMTIDRVRRPMLMIGGIEMPARVGRFRIGTIAKLVNVEAMFARRQPGDVRDDVYAITAGPEGDSAADIVALRRMQNGDRLRRVAGQCVHSGDDESCQN
jgi:hypothetical protein